jgi:hypothetical protein
VSQQDELLGLPVAKLVELISSNDLNVEREEIVFQAALKWLQANQSERASQFYKVSSKHKFCSSNFPSMTEFRLLMLFT